MNDVAPPPSSTALNRVDKLVLCFETKSFLALLLFLTLLTVVWNLQPCYETNFFSTPSTVTCAFSSFSAMPARFAVVMPVDDEKFVRPRVEIRKIVLSIADYPNRRTFHAADRFVQMGAYRGGPRTFTVVGLSSKSSIETTATSEADGIGV